MRETGDLLAIAFPFYLGLHIVWPFDQGGRFLVPMSALLMLCLFILFRRLLSKQPAILLRLVIGFTIVHLLVMLGHWIQSDLPDAAQAEKHWQELIPLVTRPAVISAIEEASLTEIIAITPNAAKKNGFQVQVLTDQRFVRMSKDNKPIPPEVRWILTKKDEVAPAAFELEMQSASFKMWKRLAGEKDNPE